MTTGSWKKYADMWAALPPPMRPTPSVIDTMVRDSTPGRTLLLGVTPEIHAAFDDLIAVDKDPNMIAAVWPGDTPGKRAMQAQWWDMEWPEASFDNIIGDCAITLLGDAAAITEFQSRCMRWLRPGGSLVHRVMTRPEIPVTEDDIGRDLRQPARINFHAFRWRMGQCVAERHDGPAPASEVYDMFQGMVPDRDGLCEATGWTRAEVDSIELYRDNPQRPFFGTKKQWLGTMPADAMDIRFTSVFDHDFSDHCPVWRWRAA